MRIVVAWLPGNITSPDLLGVIVYEPAVSPLKVNVPVELAVTVAVAAPVSFTVAPEPPLMVPEMEKVCTADVKFAVAFAPLTVTVWLAGL